MKEVFNWSELHLSEVTSYKIHILETFFVNLGGRYLLNYFQMLLANVAEKHDFMLLFMIFPIGNIPEDISFVSSF